MIVSGSRATHAQRLANLAAARQWRIDNRPYFDAIYGPEQVPYPCLACTGTGVMFTPRDTEA